MKNFKLFEFKMMLSYFLLALAIILAFNLIGNLDAILGWMGWILGVLGPFISGFIMAYLLSMPCSSLQKLFLHSNIPFLVKNRKGFSILIVYVSFLLIIYLVLSLILPQIFASAIELFNSLPAHFRWLESYLIGLNEDENFPFYLDFAALLENIDMSNLLNLIPYESLMDWLGTIFTGATAIFRGILAFISSIYFLFEADKLGLFLNRLFTVMLPKNVNSTLARYMRKINKDLKQYIFCIIIDCLVLAAVTSLLFAVLGSRYALFLGLMLGVLNAIPYFGSIIGSIIAVIVIGLTQGLTMAVIAAVLVLTVQQLDANVLQPRLYGGSLKISPLLVIISVTVGGAIWGIGGMIIAIPIASVCKSILDEIISKMEKGKVSS